jgi:hypothetical protein
MAIPVIAIQSIERVHYDLQLKKTDKKGKELTENMFEVFLKDDFLDIFLRHDYEQVFAPESKRKNMALLHVKKDAKKEMRMNPSPSKKNIKQLFIAEEENRGE